MAEFQGHGRIVDAAGGKDSATIQAAIANLGLTGGSIFVRKGTYVESVFIPASQVNLLIECEPGVIVKAVGTDEALQIGSGAQDIVIRGGQWQGISAAADGVLIDPGTRVSLEGLVIGSTTAADKVARGIVIGAGAQTFIRACTILSPTKGIEAAGSAAEVTIAECQILDPSSHGIDLLATAARVVITGNIVKNAGGHGIAVRANDGGVVGNQVYNPAGAGVYLGSSQRLAVSSNQIYDPETWGIEGDGSIKPTYCVVIGNLIYSALSGEYTNLDGTGMVVTSNTPSDNPGALHARLHAMGGTLDHNAGTHKIFYSDAAGQVQEVALGANGTYLKSVGATSVPQFASAGVGPSVITDLTATAWRVVYINGTGNVVELALGANGTVLRGKGASVAPAFETEFGTPSLTLGTAAAAGSATTGVRTDATLPIFDVTVPVTQAFADAAAVGSAAFAARRDHRHGMPPEFIGYKKILAGSGSATQISLTSLTGYRRYKLLIELGDGSSSNVIYCQINGGATLNYAQAGYSASAVVHTGVAGTASATIAGTTQTNNGGTYIEIDLMWHSASYAVAGRARVYAAATNTFYDSGLGTQGAASSISAILVNWGGSSTYNYILLGLDDVA